MEIITQRQYAKGGEACSCEKETTGTMQALMSKGAQAATQRGFGNICGVMSDARLKVDSNGN